MRHLIAFSLLISLAVLVQAADVDIKLTSTDGSTKMAVQNSAAAEVASIDSVGKLTVSSHVVTSGYVEMPELAATANPSADKARLYAKDVGGTTYLAYKDSAGSERLMKPQAFITLSGFETAGTNIGVVFKDVHFGLDASKLATTIADFTGYTQARFVFQVDNNEGDTIECQAYNVTDAAAIAGAISDNTGNAQTVSSAWTNIALTGDKTIRAECREGVGATADPDIGIVMLQLR